MNDELQWFACLCLDSGIVDRERCRQIYDSLEDPEDLLAFGQHFLDEGLVEDIEVVQQLLDDACDRVDAEEKPPYDPFAPVEPAVGRGLKLAASTPEPIEAPSVEPAPAETPAVAPTAPSAEEPDSAAVAEPPRETASSSAGGGADPAGQADRKPAESVVPADGLDPVLPDFDAILSLPERQLRAALIGLLKRCVETGASDLHLSAAARPFERKDRENHYLSETVLSAEAARRLNTALLNAQQIEYFDRKKDFDFAIPFSTGERFRVNLMYHKDGMAGTYRMVPPKIRSLEALGFENAEVIKKLLSYHNGLILVTGPAGCGKTATLASLVHEMNQNREDHVITVEEPIEMVQVSNKCSITQRGVGPHTNTFHSALKGALRQDPDIIVIGEMRDLETIEMAISASETGHLVIGTMHTSDAAT
ncbi:MAG: ATPase, T2SS/T4P/T4SS family, partial [Opitutales bacterium]